MRTIGEILLATKEAKTDDEKVEVLEKYKDFPHLKYFLTSIVDQEKKYWTLPEGFTYSKRNHVIGRCPPLTSQTTTVKYFEEPTRLREDRLVSLFLGLMDTLHSSETDLLEALFNNKELEFLPNSVIAKVYGLEKKPVKKAKVAKKKDVAKVEEEEVVAETSEIKFDDVETTEEVKEKSKASRKTKKSAKTED